MSRHAVITGAGSGIGAEIVTQLHSAGYRTSLIGRRLEPLQAQAKSLGETAHGISADVSDRVSVKQGMEQARELHGPIDILVNCAGQAPTSPFHKTSSELWDSVFAVNLHGVFNCTQEALTDMRDSGWGRIVNIASTGSLKGYAYLTAYCSAKHAVLGLTRALALEVAASGITVNAVCPGYTDTDIIRNAVDNIVTKTGRSTEEALAHFTATNPQQRLVQPSEVAASVLWLCSDAGQAINGQAIAIDGGETA